MATASIARSTFRIVTLSGTVSIAGAKFKIEVMRGNVDAHDGLSAQLRFQLLNHGRADARALRSGARWDGARADLADASSSSLMICVRLVAERLVYG